MSSSSFFSKEFPRPNFQNAVYTTAVKSHNVFTDSDIDPKDPELGSRNAAVPHRMSWADMRDRSLDFVNGKEDENDFLRWTGRYLKAAYADKEIIENYKADCNKDYNTAKGADQKRLEDHIAWCDEIMGRIDDCVKKFKSQRAFLTSGVKAYYGKSTPHNVTKTGVVELMTNFLSVANSFYANVPDLGPHRGTNIQVSNRVHLHINEDGSLSPMSEQVLNMTPGTISGVATTPKQTNIVTTSGDTFPINNLSPNTKQKVLSIGTHPVNAKKPKWNPE